GPWDPATSRVPVASGEAPLPRAERPLPKRLLRGKGPDGAGARVPAHGSVETPEGSGGTPLDRARRGDAGHRASRGELEGGGREGPHRYSNAALVGAHAVLPGVPGRIRRTTTGRVIAGCALRMPAAATGLTGRRVGWKSSL